MFMFNVYIEFCLGIRVGNEVRKVVGMTLIPSMPKSISRHFCMIVLQNSNLDRGLHNYLDRGVNKPSIKGPLKPRSSFIPRSRAWKTENYPSYRKINVSLCLLGVLTLPFMAHNWAEFILIDSSLNTLSIEVSCMHFGIHMGFF